MLRQFGLQRHRACPQSLPEPVQGVMEWYGRPKSVVYDSGYHIPDNLHQPNTPVFTLHFQEEYPGGPGHLRWYSPLLEHQLRHTYQSFPSGPVWILLPSGLYEPHIHMILLNTSGSIRSTCMDTPTLWHNALLNGRSIRPL